MLDWQDIQIFAALARAGSLSAAARALKVNHATISRRIESLERALSIRLVERLPRRVILTEDGAAIARLAGPMEEAAAAIARHAKGARGLKTIRVSAPPATAVRLIAPKLAPFHHDHPEIKLILLGEARAVALDRGAADIAVRMVRPDNPELIARKIGVMRFALYATPAHAAKDPDARGFVAYDESLDHLPQQAWLKAIVGGRPVVFEASDLFGQQEAARAGLGAVVLPRFIGDTDPTLVPLAAPTPPPDRDLWLTYYPSLGRDPAMRAVLDFLAETIAAGCPLS